MPEREPIWDRHIAAAAEMADHCRTLGAVDLDRKAQPVGFASRVYIDGKPITGTTIGKQRGVCNA